jgi:hypothetical protein
MTENKYCHVIGVWMFTGLGMMAGFIGLFDIARDYTLQLPLLCSGF